MLKRILDHLMNKHPWMWRYRHLWNKEAILNQLSDESLNHAHRQFLLKEIEKFEPFDSLLEFGCGMGANLDLLANKYPEKKFFGYDMDEKLRFLRKRYLNVEFVDFLDEVDRVDIVLVDAVFIYMEPVLINMDIERLKAVAKKAMILFEWGTTDEPLFDGHWVHNYRKLLPGSNINVIKDLFLDDKGWQKWGACITWRK